MKKELKQNKDRNEKRTGKENFGAKKTWIISVTNF